MSTTFIHTADWQLGKPFGSVTDPHKCSLLQAERFNAVKRIGGLVNKHGAAFVVVAGDLLDSPTASNATVAEACSVIAQIGVPVYVIPGNHDHGGPGSVWDQEFFRRERAALAPNLQLLLEPTPVVTEHAVLLPCPLLRRHESLDPSAWLRGFADAEGQYGDKPRIVLAHGSVTRFDSGEEWEESNRLELEHLPLGEFDYLALGDWHGAKQVHPKAWYSGTPEPDRFSKGGGHSPGHTLVVNAARVCDPQVIAARTGRVGWHELEFEFGDDPACLGIFDSKIEELVGVRANEDVLQLCVSGTLGIDAGNEWERRVESLAARLLHVRVRGQVAIAPTVQELEALVHRNGDPLVARVAARLWERLKEGGAGAEVARTALRELHAVVKN